MPAVKSRNSLPSTSWTHTPSPFAITSGYGRVKLVERAPWSRETSAAARGPGRVFAILGRRAPFGAATLVVWAEADPTGPSLLIRVRNAMISGAVIGSHNE